MADAVPWFLYMAHRDEIRGVTSSNQAMVEDLVLSGSLRSVACTAAFQAVDRQHFWPSEPGHLAYQDAPLRSGFLHISAPHIYAKSLESMMPMRRGMSFLNIGSGTGYFNSVVSELIGDAATNHGVDIRPETVAHANSCCQRLGKQHIAFTVGNIYQLNVRETARYDRIYVGACANPRSKYLYDLLEVGGVLVGPFQVGRMQQLRRVTRQTETHFAVEMLGSVQFASLVEPPPPRPPPPPLQRPIPFVPPERHGAASCAGGLATPLGGAGVPSSGNSTHGFPGVPVTFALKESAWAPERNWLYPASFRRAVMMGLLSRPHNESLQCLPTEIWVKHIFPLCTRRWFEPDSLGNVIEEQAMAPMSLPCACGPEEGAQSDGDGSSTRAPTPQLGPNRPPSSLEATPPMGPARELPGGSERPPLVEVFGNGQQHYIGERGDPDDSPLDERPRLVVPTIFLQRDLAAAPRRGRTPRRRQRSMSREGSSEEDVPDGAEEEDEEQLAAGTEVDIDEDEVMAEAERDREDGASGSDSEMADAEAHLEP